MYILCITGDSACGKTTLARLLQAALSALLLSSSVLGMDDYFLETTEEQDKDLDAYLKQVNFTKLSAMNIALLVAHIQKLSENTPIDKPAYNFKTHKYERFDRINPADVLIVEGVHAINFARKYLQAFDDKMLIYIDLDSRQEVMDRRVTRNVNERDWKDAESVKKYDQQFAGVTFFTEVAPTKTFADYVVNNTQRMPNDTPLDITKPHTMTNDAQIIAKEIQDRLAAAKSLQSTSVTSTSSFLK
jgi:uridine kinase